MPAERRVIVSAPVTSGGLYAHIRNVLPRLRALRPDWRFEVYGPQEVFRDAFGRTDEPWMHVWDNEGRGARLRWEFLQLPRLLRADRQAMLLAMFGPFLNLRLARRAVVRLDNLIVLLKPSERRIGKADRNRIRILRHVYLANAKRALRPVCASLHSRARYVAQTGQPASRFAVVPHGIDPSAFARIRPSPAVEELQRSGPYVLTIGQATPYRCTRELILAYRLLSERGTAGLPRLVWAGKARQEDAGYEAECLELLAPLARAGLATHLGHVSHEDVYALDAGARLFVHPSVHEDCPNTIFEALAAGVPVLCSDIAANREFARDAVFYLDAPTPDVIASAIEALLSDPRRCAELRERGPIQARSLSWDDTARRLAATLDDAFAARS
ncbi:MAG TPA: glycosyltransferase family 1 protein [Candidatus Polarisedimenticolaceae bacterium]|nr:glycosyltransferase family 1 protein [Candidatus Polarisedimenticolaceae bacterium]